jgi:hypothetical protein
MKFEIELSESRVRSLERLSRGFNEPINELLQIMIGKAIGADLDALRLEIWKSKK